MNTIEALVVLTLALYCAKTTADLWDRIGPRALQAWRRRRDDRNRRAVWLNSHGHRKIEVIKVVREHTGLGLKEAKEASEGIPSKLLATDLSPERAEAFAEELRAVGASVTVADAEAIPEGVKPCTPVVRS